MTIRIGIAAITAASALSTAAAQDSGVFYLEAGLGVVAPTTDEVEVFGTDVETGEEFTTTFDTGFETGGQFHILGGYEVTPTLAIELDVRGHGHTDEFSGDDEVTVVGTYLVNAVYRGSEAAKVVPYVGVGIGIANVDIVTDDGTFETGFDDAVAYQVKAGIAKPVGVHHSFALEASYLRTGTFEDDEAFPADRAEFTYGGFNVGVNYRYRFGTR